MTQPSEPSRPFVPVVAHHSPQPLPPRPPTRHLPQPRPPVRKGLSAGWWLLVSAGVTLVLVVGIGLVVAVRTAEGPGSGPDGPQARITDCDADGGIARISYEVTNRGSRAKTIFVGFSVADASGTRVGTGSAVEPDVPAGKTVVGDTVVILPEGRSAARCKVDSVR
jgi:hypothetical protein